jgi:hypothetical protein
MSARIAVVAILCFPGVALAKGYLTGPQQAQADRLIANPKVRDQREARLNARWEQTMQRLHQIESDPKLRALAKAKGLIILGNTETTNFRLDHYKKTLFLTDEGLRVWKTRVSEGHSAGPTVTRRAKLSGIGIPLWSERISAEQWKENLTPEGIDEKVDHFLRLGWN